MGTVSRGFRGRRRPSVELPPGQYLVQDFPVLSAGPTPSIDLADWDSLWSPETYVGYERAENFASPDGAVLDARHVYATPARLRLNHWALAGDWTVDRQAIVLNETDGRIAYRFHARDLHLVMGPAQRETLVRFRVHIDGQPPGAAHGTDVDDQGDGTVTDPRLYQLVRQPGPVTERTFEVTFLDAGVQAYAFTFG